MESSTKRQSRHPVSRMGRRRASGAFGGKTEMSITRNYVRAAGLLQTLLVLAQPAHAQDITILVYGFAPPILLSPVFLTIVRWFWLRRGTDSPARIVPLFVVSCIEVVCWIALGACVALFMTGDWNIREFAVFPVACVALWMLPRIWFDPSQRAARWLYLVSAPLVLVLLAAAAWLVILAL